MTDPSIPAPALTSPFHAGEQRVQERLGVRDIEGWARKVVRDHLPEKGVTPCIPKPEVSITWV